MPLCKKPFRKRNSMKSGSDGILAYQSIPLNQMINSRQPQFWTVKVEFHVPWFWTCIFPLLLQWWNQSVPSRSADQKCPTACQRHWLSCSCTLFDNFHLPDSKLFKLFQTSPPMDLPLKGPAFLGFFKFLLPRAHCSISCMAANTLVCISVPFSVTSNHILIGSDFETGKKYF